MNPNRLEQWQYQIFKLVLFILFLVTVYRLLDHELRISQLLARTI
jgi:hypothetical protein